MDKEAGGRRRGRRLEEENGGRLEEGERLEAGGEGEARGWRRRTGGG